MPLEKTPESADLSRVVGFVGRGGIRLRERILHCRHVG